VYSWRQPDVAALRQEVQSVASADATEVPILVVEVLSAATRRRDRQVKTRHYLRAGTSEVWLVDPVDRSIEVVTGDSVRRHTADDTASSVAVPGFALSWSALDRDSA
jgi:Uma2 family endonuclease